MTCTFSYVGCNTYLYKAYLRDIAGVVPDHHNKVNITRKRVNEFFSFPVHNVNYMESIKCVIALYLTKIKTLF